MASESAPERKCGKTTEYSESRLPGNVTCWRKTWKNHEQCIWHAPVDDKPADELVEARTDQPERLDEAVLRDVDLDNRISFVGCVLVGADLAHADIFSPERIDIPNWGPQSRDVSLRNGDLRRANLFDADLTPADLRGADLTDADFQNAELRHTDMGGADLTDANFELADLSHAYLRGARVKETKFLDADLSSVDLGGTDMTTSKIRGVDLTDANLRRADFTDTDLFGADLTDADLRSVTLTESNLQGCDLTGANARNSNLDNALVEHTILTRADLRGASLVDASLYQVQLSDTRIDRRTAFGETCIYEADGRSPTIATVEDEVNEITPLEAATWVYRRLEALHAENAMAERAREYHVCKEEAQRKAYWANWNNFEDLDRKRDYIHEWNFPKALIYEVNRWTSRHGESPYRVVGLSLGTVLLGAVLYPFAGIKPTDSSAISWTNALDASSGVIDTGVTLLAVVADSIYFSTVTFTTLGYGDVRPLGWAKALATVESFLGALLMALLVFVLGRRATW